ncbi:DUF6230 family protein [Nocardioides sp. NPDC023903]|uniref:DUF6230 family protein n=1 Tax=Nocardioides sp. NPDC023903 TaxID=3157195 RepID=UPI003406F483
MSTYGTRWRRMAAATTVGFGLLAGMVATMGSSASAVFSPTLTTNNGSSTFSSTNIHAADAAFGTSLVQTQAAASSGGDWTPVLRAGFASATMNGFCLSRVEEVGMLGSYTIRLTSGDDDPATNEINAQMAVFDITQLRAAAAPGINLQGVAQIGLASTDLTTNPGSAPYAANPMGLPQAFDSSWYQASGNGGHNNGQGFTGIDATVADLNSVYGDVWQAQIEGEVTLPNLEIEVLPGNQSCKAAAQAGRFPN